MIDNFKLTAKKTTESVTYNDFCVASLALKPLASLYVNSLDNPQCKVGNTWELLDVTLQLDPYQPYLNIFDRPFKHEYLAKEHAWYMSQDRSIIGWMDDIKIWNFCASKDDKKEINSNYGWCVFSKENGSQYENCLQKLKNDVNTREAMMIYTRPSIHADAVENGKHDFICTNHAHIFIRQNKLRYIVSQRSCDIITGLSFDFPWHCFVYQMLLTELRQTYPTLEAADMHYHIDSLHVYDRHEELLKQYAIKNNFLTDTANENK